MASIYQVDPNELIEKVSQELKKLSGIHAPEWAQFVKTGIHKERAPVNPDWWYVRVAAVLRTVFMRGPVGVSKLRTKYGGKQNRGHAPERFAKGAGNILRKALQQLEVEGLVMKSPDEKKKGRVIAPKGQSLLEKTALLIRPKLEKVKTKKEVKVEKAPKTESKEDSKVVKKAPKKESKASKVESKEEVKVEKAPKTDSKEEVVKEAPKKESEASKEEVKIKETPAKVESKEKKE